MLEEFTDIEMNALKYANLGGRLLQEGFVEKPYIHNKELPQYELELFSDYKVIFDVDDSWEEGSQVHFGIYSKRYGQLISILANNDHFNFEEYKSIGRVNTEDGEIGMVGPWVEVHDNNVFLSSGGVEFTIPELSYLLKNIDSPKALFEVFYASNPQSDLYATKLYTFYRTIFGSWFYLYICCECNMSDKEIIDYYATPQTQAKIKAWRISKDIDELLIREFKKVYASLLLK